MLRSKISIASFTKNLKIGDVDFFKSRFFLL